MGKYNKYFNNRIDQIIKIPSTPNPLIKKNVKFKSQTNKRPRVKEGRKLKKKRYFKSNPFQSESPELEKASFPSSKIITRKLVFPDKRVHDVEMRKRAATSNWLS